MHIFVGLLYIYLEDCVEKNERGEAFRSLLHSFDYWSFGRLANMKIHFHSSQHSPPGKYIVALQKCAHWQHVGDLPALSEDEEVLPIMSYLCQWNAPQKRKESNMPISEAVFQKYDRQQKCELKPIENFDP